MLLVSHGNQASFIEIFNSTFRFLEALLYGYYFFQMVDKIYPKERQLSKALIPDTETLFPGI